MDLSGPTQRDEEVGSSEGAVINTGELTDHDLLKDLSDINSLLVRMPRVKKRKGMHSSAPPSPTFEDVMRLDLSSQRTVDTSPATNADSTTSSGVPSIDFGKLSPDYDSIVASRRAEARRNMAYSREGIATRTRGKQSLMITLFFTFRLMVKLLMAP